MLGIVETENQTKKIATIAGSAQGSGIPVGSVIAMYASRAPSDAWLLCDGSTFDPSKYPALAMYLGANKVPDLRECVLVGAGESDNDYDASTNPNGIHAHDVYAVGEFKDDQLQRIRGQIGLSGAYWEGAQSALDNRALYSSGSGRREGNDGNSGGYWLHIDSSRTTRSGYDSSGTLVGADVTHGKQFGLNYFIKATSSSDDSDYQGTLEQIREYAKTAGSPLGTWQSFESGVAPNDDWLEAGSTFNVNDYPALAMLLGTNKVPDKFDHTRLSNYEDITFPSSQATAMTMLYDGVLFVNDNLPNNACIKLSQDGGTTWKGIVGSSGFSQFMAELTFNKGDMLYINEANRTGYIAYYKHPMFIKGVPNSSDKDFQGTLMEIRQYSRNQGCPLGTWMAFENDQAPSDAWLAAGTIFDPDKYPALAMMLGTNKVPERFDHNRLTEWYNFYAYNNNSWVMTSAPYDGFVTVSTSGATGQSVNIKINDVNIISNSNAGYGVNGVGEIAFKKGDKIELTGNLSSSIRNFICFCQHSMFIKAFPTSDDSDYQGTLAAIKKYINDQNELSDYEQITLSTSSSNPTIMPYDGNLVVKAVGNTRVIYINGAGVGTASPTGSVDASGTVDVKKGDAVYLSNYYNGCAYIAYYKKRDYSNR